MLYMNEKTLELHAGCEPLKRDLRSMIQLLLRTDPRRDL
jgi:N-formylglutamate deformylase